MKIIERQIGDVVLLDIHGKILIGEGDETLRKYVMRLVDTGKTNIIFNLEDVSYVDAAGNSAIVHSYAAISRRGGKLKFLKATKKIRDLWTITRLLTVFEIYDSEEEAVASF